MRKLKNTVAAIASAVLISACLSVPAALAAEEDGGHAPAVESTSQAQVADAASASDGEVVLHADGKKSASKKVVWTPKEMTAFHNLDDGKGNYQKAKVSFKGKKLVVKSRLRTYRSKTPTKYNVFKLTKKSFIGEYHDTGYAYEDPRYNDPRYRMSKKEFAKKAASGRYAMTIIVKDGRVLSANLLG